jgi:hypothetical protein
MCGAVKLEIELPPKWCANCHCSMCRRAHTAAFVAWVGVECDNFRLTAGEQSLVRYASSADSRRSFCRECGSTLLFESERWPGEVHIARACFDDDADLRPMAHAYYDDRPQWSHVGDELPKLGGESGTQPLE